MKKIKPLRKEEVSFSTPQKRVIKNKLRKLRRNQNSQSNESSSIVTPESNTQHQADEPMLISTSLWGFLSPSAKKKVKSKLQNEQLLKGMNYQFRKELGINLSIKTKNTDSTTALQKSIEDFFLRDDVTRVCPETKKLKRNPNDLDEELPLRYRMSTLRCMTSSLLKARIPVVILISALIVPIMLRSQAPMIGEHVFAEHCLNPEIKLEALAKVLNAKSFKWDDTKDYNDIKDMIKRIEHLTFNKTITFSEWQMVEQNDKKGKKFSRKVLVTLDFAKFGQLLVKELNVMRDHQYRPRTLSIQSFQDGERGSQIKCRYCNNPVGLVRKCKNASKS